MDVSTSVEVPKWLGTYATEVLSGGTLLLFSVWLGFICKYLRGIRQDVSMLQQELVRLRNDIRRDFNDHLVKSERRFTALEEHDKYIDKINHT